MSPWMTLVLLIVTIALSGAFLVLPRWRSPTNMAAASLDFTNGRRRAPHTRRPPPNGRRGDQLSFRD